jgi:hypothetical protein
MAPGCCNPGSNPGGATRTLQKAVSVLQVPDYVPADWPSIYDPPSVRLNDLTPVERPLVRVSGRGAGRRLQRVGYPLQLSPGGSP